MTNKIFINFDICTDGDFYLEKLPDGMESYVKCDDEDYTINAIFEKKEDEKDWQLKGRAKLLLTSIFVNFRFGTNHYYISDYMFKLIDGAVDFINKNKEGIYSEGISGNYEGTDLYILMV